jgi:hypothetical protein
MSETKSETVTFRIDAELKEAFAEIAEQEAKPVGQLLRELVRDCVKQRQRRAFEAEARRQSLLIAADARDSTSDETAVMRELEAHFEEVMREWK